MWLWLRAGGHKQGQLLASEFDAGRQSSKYLTVCFDENAVLGAIEGAALNGVGVEKLDGAGKSLTTDDGSEQEPQVVEAAACLERNDAEILLVERGARCENP